MASDPRPVFDHVTREDFYPDRRLRAGTSHWPHLDKPDEFNRVVDTFLASMK